MVTYLRKMLSDPIFKGQIKLYVARNPAPHESWVLYNYVTLFVGYRGGVR